MFVGLLIFYGVALMIILVGGVSAFVLFRRKSLMLAGVSSLGVMSVLVLIWPLPIHGGFMFLGEAIYDEWSRDREQIVQQVSAEKKQVYLDNLNNRFRGELPVRYLVQLSEQWISVSYGLDQSAWMDTTSGLIWSDWLLLPLTDSLPSLRIGKLRCSEKAPAGFWALPTEAEHIIMKRAGGAEILPEAEIGSMSYIVDTDLKVEIPTYQVKAGNNSFSNKTGYFSVQCVARGPGSPERGYIKEDISLEEWNHYQISKLTR